MTLNNLNTLNNLHTSNISNTQIKIIHTILSEWEIDDNEYRGVLQDLFGVDSSLKLTEVEADELIHYLNYSNNASYKYGYDKAYNELIGFVDLKAQFKKFKPSNLEIKMFDLLDTTEQKQILKELSKTNSKTLSKIVKPV